MERPQYGTDTQRWQALLRRDHNADGHFYYSVKSTGVYCRPGCASRLPRRENVQFHSCADAAERRGFRPCKRCQPNGATLPDHHAAIVVKACRIISSADRIPRLATLAKSVGMSPFHLHRVFTRLVGLTPKAYAVAQRAERMRKALPRHRTVTEAIYGAGFTSSSRFYSLSRAMLGMPPRDFRQGGTGALIRFAIGKCALGSVLVASSQTGVCAVLLGDDPDGLVRDLRNTFPSAQLRHGDPDYERVVSRVIHLVGNPRCHWNLPLDVRGTAFQQKVWTLLREIPCGTTRTYSEIAAELGQPQASRAVAGACAANRIAVAIPCHRAVRVDGSLAGYRWGLKRKAHLLSAERKNNPS